MLAALALAYAFGAAIVIPHALSFPDALFHGGAPGNSQTSIWLWVAWHAAFPLLVALALLARDLPPLPRRRVAPAAIAVMAVGYGLVALCGVLAFDTTLPTLVVNGNFTAGFANGTWEAVLAIDVFALVTVVAIGRTSSTLSLWLSVSLVAVVGDATLTLLSAAASTSAGTSHASTPHSAPASSWPRCSPSSTACTAASRAWRRSTA
ncbi:MAG TPA: MASE4 domain-containing protein [Candidatus Sulfotelmatobacter sp.]|nr:MASE4 domain-containing protein [Candidatus Sulfotelmatobacter sp.]